MENVIVNAGLHLIELHQVLLIVVRVKTYSNLTLMQFNIYMVLTSPFIASCVAKLHDPIYYFVIWWILNPLVYANKHEQFLHEWIFSEAKKVNTKIFFSNRFITYLWKENQWINIYFSIKFDKIASDLFSSFFFSHHKYSTGWNWH